MSLSEWTLLAGMCLVTVAFRTLPFVLADRIRLPQTLRQALSYTPVAVLTAIVFPAVLAPRDSLWLSPANPWLLAAIVAAWVAYLSRNLLMTIVSGLLTFLIGRWLVEPMF